MGKNYKLAFTTLGCPSWDLDTIIIKAIEYGFDGIDFRGYMGELDLSKVPLFTTEVEDTAELLASEDLEVPCFSSSICLFPQMPSETAKYYEEMKFYVSLCEHFNTPFIRIFGGELKGASRLEAMDVATRNLINMAKYAEDHDVTLLLETHDDWLACDHLIALMERINSNAVGILWDTHHPYRVIGEPFAKTWEVLGEWIRYTHWKDSIARIDTEMGYEYCIFGDGDLPLKDIYFVLKNGKYKGYFTLEWEKIWHPEIEDPEIVFPIYVKILNDFMSDYGVPE
jgi:sugar phosphate isomerase/epimerase